MLSFLWVHIQVLNNVAGDIWRCFKWFLKERFNSVSKIKNILCPILLIHGKEDEVIRWEHSTHLYEEAIKRDKNWELQIRVGMDHNNFSFKLDIIDPIKFFLASNKISWDKISSMKQKLTLWELENHDSTVSFQKMTWLKEFCLLPKNLMHK